MNLQKRCSTRPSLRYSIAIAAVAAGFALQQGLAALVGGDLPHYITFYPAVVVAALLGGLGPGLLATALAAGVVDYWIASPRALFLQDSPGEITGWILFSFMGACLSWLTAAYRRAGEKAAAYQQELALRQNERALQLALEAGDLGTVDYHFETGEVFWDRRCRQLFGVAEEDRLAYEQVIARIHEADRPRVDAAVQTALSPSSSGAYECEYRTVRADRSVRWVAAKGQVFFEGEGTARRPQRFIGTVRDITEWKRTEAALAQARDELELRVRERTARLQQAVRRLSAEIRARREKERELVEAELRYRTVADFTYDWEFWITPDGRLRYCSPSCERVSGYTVPELVADPELMSRLVHADDRESWRLHHCNAVAEPGPRSLQFRIHHKDGQLRWIDHVCQPILGRDGAFLGVRASNRDITERRTAELDAQHLRTELARISRITTAGQLAAALAHELNQPLGAIVCNAQAAQQWIRQTPPRLIEVEEALADMAADGKRAGKVIHRLRGLYQQTSQVKTVLPIRQVVEDTVELMRSEFLLRAVPVEIELAPDLPLVCGDYTQLQQVIINLIVNALDAMTARGPGAHCLRITASRQDAATIGISFRDSGTGLTDTQLARLGEPFFTTKATGMGMGLAISRSILEAHGGRLWAENNPDGGATFHLSLPLSPPPPA